MLAQVAEILHALYRSHLSANGIAAHELPRPLRVPRPGDQAAPRRRAATVDEVHAVIEAAWGPG